jgi:hypothetical protein
MREAGKGNYMSRIRQLSEEIISMTATKDQVYTRLLVEQLVKAVQSRAESDVRQRFQREISVTLAAMSSLASQLGVDIVRQAACPRCGRPVQVRRDGKVRLHRSLEGERCDASLHEYRDLLVQENEEGKEEKAV